MGKKSRKRQKSLQHGISQANNSYAIPKQQQLGKERKEMDLIDRFEERQIKEKPAVMLKLEQLQSRKGEPISTSTPKETQKKKAKWRNDGVFAIHKPISELINETGRTSCNSVKRKMSGSLEMRSAGQNYALEDSDEIVQLDLNNGASKDTEKQSNKRMKLESSASTNDVSPSQNNEMLLDEEESLEDEEVDDLEDEQLKTDDDAELLNGNMDDEDELEQSSFISGSLEDEEGIIGEDYFNEEDTEVDGDDEMDEEMSVQDEISYQSLSEEDDESLDLSFTGYESIAPSDKCLVFKAKDDYSMATVPFELFKFSKDVEHSVQVGLKALLWIICPVDSQTFFKNIFQKRVMLVKRNMTKDYFDGLFGKQDFIDMLQKFDMKYGNDVNVAIYEDGVRKTLNGSEYERANVAAIWKHIAQGRSAQLVRPQLHNNNIWYLCEILQEVFCSFVGANCYLTPPGSSGFAPHWDDIDAFMLQTEGRKYWKVYAPSSDDDTLPMKSSANFTDLDLEDRKPSFEGWLDQGDTLYVPRGWIHNAHTGTDVHSLHVTVSVCRQHSFADFLEKASTEFVQTLVASSKNLRRALPPLLLDMGGVAECDYPGEETLHETIVPIIEIFARKFGKEFSSCVHSYIDIIAREFFHTALPPLLTPQEMSLAYFGHDLVKPADFGAETEVRLIRKHAQRLLFEDDESAFLVHRMNNSRQYEACPESSVEFPTEFEDGFTLLYNAYPKWTKVCQLSLPSMEQNISLVTLLFENGLLLRREVERTPLPKVALHRTDDKKKGKTKDERNGEKEGLAGKKSPSKRKKKNKQKKQAIPAGGRQQ